MVKNIGHYNEAFLAADELEKRFTEARKPKQRDPEVRSEKKHYHLTQLLS